LTGPEQHAAIIREARETIEAAIDLGNKRCAIGLLPAIWDHAADALVVLSASLEAAEERADERQRELDETRAAWSYARGEADALLQRLKAAEERADRSDELMRRAESARAAAEERASQLQKDAIRWHDEYVHEAEKRADSEQRASQLEHDLMEARAVWSATRGEADSLLHRASQLEQERDDWKERCILTGAEDSARVEQARREADQLRAALRWYDDHKRDDGSYDGETWGDLAALAGVQAKEQEPWDQDDYAEARS